MGGISLSVVMSVPLRATHGDSLSKLTAVLAGPPNRAILPGSVCTRLDTTLTRESPQGASDSHSQINLRNGGLFRGG